MIGGSAEQLYTPVAFVSGMVIAGFCAPWLGTAVAAAAATPPSLLSGGSAAYVAAGLLVGAGTSLGNGCTSGHGLCGLSRYSVRSLAATATFMASAATVTLGRAGGFPTSMVPLVHDAERATCGSMAFAAAAAAVGSTLGCELACGCVMTRFLLDAALAALFGLGLLVGGMVEQSVVMGAFGYGRVWNPQLFVLFTAALCTTFVAYRVVGRMRAPVAARSFAMPRNQTVDARLLIGAATFGAGWALAGQCPGPWVVNLATGAGEYFAFGFGLVAGVSAVNIFDILSSAAPQTPAGYTTVNTPAPQSQ